MSAVRAAVNRVDAGSRPAATRPAAAVAARPIAAAAPPIAVDERASSLPTLEHWIAYRFGLVSSRVGRVIAPIVWSRHRLKLWEWRALAVIARFQPLSAKALAEHSSSDPINVARAIRALTDKGLASREADPADRRRAVLRLTARGKVVHAELAQVAAGIEKTLSATLTADERATLERVLAKIDRQVPALAGLDAAPTPRVRGR